MENLPCRSVPCSWILLCTSVGTASFFCWDLTRSSSARPCSRLALSRSRRKLFSFLSLVYTPTFSISSVGGR